MIRFIQKSYSRTTRTLIGAGLSLTGAGILSQVNKDGKLTGTSEFYHGTKKKNVDKILREGLTTKHARDKNTLLKQVYGKDYIPEDSNVYLARHRGQAEEVNKVRTKVSRKKPWKSEEELDEATRKGSEVLDVNIPRHKFKNMKQMPNPEVLGAETKKEFLKRYREKNPKIEVTDKQLGQIYKQLTKDTVTLGEDVPADYIKGSKKYKTNKLRNFKDNVKNNKTEFMKELGKTALGAAGIGAGLRMITKGKLYSQKNFTRKDAESIKEIYRATNGFRRFPKGAINLSARDIARLKQLTHGKGKTQLDELAIAFNNEEGKQLLRKMNLHKTADNIEHLTEKYGNDALAERYKNMPEYKKGIKGKLQQLFKRKPARKPGRKIKQLEQQISDGHDYSIERFDITTKEGNTEVGRQLKRKFIDQAQKKEKTVVKRDKSNYASNKGYIGLKKESHPFTAGHETGHIRALRSGLGKWGPDDSLEHLTDEALASSYAITRGQKLGATSDQLKNGQEMLEHAFNTHYQSYLRKTADELKQRYFK